MRAVAPQWLIKTCSAFCTSARRQASSRKSLSTACSRAFSSDTSIAPLLDTKARASVAKFSMCGPKMTGTPAVIRRVSPRCEAFPNESHAATLYQRRSLPVLSNKIQSGLQLLWFSTSLTRRTLIDRLSSCFRISRTRSTCRGARKRDNVGKLGR